MNMLILGARCAVARNWQMGAFRTERLLAIAGDLTTGISYLDKVGIAVAARHQIETPDNSRSVDLIKFREILSSR
jgi:hypothetical protein